MPTAYRVELAKTARAGCKNTECSKNGNKIEKGELRFGNLVEIKDHQSWHWKHWGCVTPVQIVKWDELCEGDTDLIDGFDDIPAGMQEKVLRALQQGHVDDEDWRGDVECNRPGQKGFRLSKKAKQEMEVAQDSDGEIEAAGEPSKAEKPAGKKPSRASQTADGDDDDDEMDTKPTSKKAKANAKKAKVSNRKQALNEDEDEAPAPKKAAGRAKKAKASQMDGADDGVDDGPAIKTQSKFKKSSRAEDATESSMRKKTTRTKKLKVEDVGEDVSEEEQKPQKGARGKKKFEADDDDAPVPVAKKIATKRKARE